MTRLCHYQRSKRSAYNDSIYLLVFTKDDSKPDVVHPCYFGVIDPGLPWSSVDKFKVISLQKQHARDHTAGPWTTNRTQYGRCDICVRKCCRAKYLETRVCGTLDSWTPLPFALETSHSRTLCWEVHMWTCLCRFRDLGFYLTLIDPRLPVA